MPEMFSSKAPAPMTLTSFAEQPPGTFNTLLCEGMTARNVPSLAALVALLRKVQAARPAQRVLSSLDWLDQASYTSGHAVDKHQLDAIEGHDLSRLDPAAFENGQHRGYLSTLSEFPIRLSNLLRQTGGVTVSDLARTLDWSVDDERFDLVSINREPDLALRLTEEKMVVIQLVPVNDPAEAIAAFPNGYFVDDLDPMAGHALARHLNARFGLALFGVGARLLGFWRDEALDSALASAVAADLVLLCDAPPADATRRLADALYGKHVVLVRYTNG